jgi:hypothetical protein
MIEHLRNENSESKELLSICTWTGKAHDGLCSTNNNCDSNVAPVAGDDIVFQKEKPACRAVREAGIF